MNPRNIPKPQTPNPEDRSWSKRDWEKRAMAWRRELKEYVENFDGLYDEEH